MVHKRLLLLVEELNSIYPEARILRLDTDTTGTKDAAAQILSKFSNGEADIDWEPILQ